MFERLSRSFEKEKQFTSDVSHELRTPLSVIKAQCEFALSDSASEEDREEALSAIQRQTDRMAKMTDQLLMLTRADKGNLKLEKKPVDLGRLVKNICEDLMPAAEAAGLSLKEDIDTHITVEGDSTLLSRLVTNLLTNAIKYNREGGEIRVTFKIHGSDCLLEVSDTGAGIKKDELPLIWDRFYRAERSRSSEGSGLGLSMVKSIAELHKGSVYAESKEGIGSSFFVKLPLS